MCAEATAFLSPVLVWAAAQVIFFHVVKTTAGFEGWVGSGISGLFLERMVESRPRLIWPERPFVRSEYPSAGGR